MVSLEAEASRDPLWAPLAEYYKLRRLGLRDRAILAAGRFAESAQTWSFEERKRFSLWLIIASEKARNRGSGSSFRQGWSGVRELAPYVIVKIVVCPTLVEWSEEDATDPEPHYWLAMYGDDTWTHLTEALIREPTYSPACAARINIIINGVKYNQHELPSGYIDDAFDDLEALREAKNLALHVDDLSLRADMQENIASLMERAEDWIHLKEKLRGLNWIERSSIWAGRRNTVIRH